MAMLSSWSTGRKSFALVHVTTTHLPRCTTQERHSYGLKSIIVSCHYKARCKG